ncbi:MAG TPA: M48 family metallopeptidase [Burkholderiales bacterium]|jgi:STE24 endopeptidase|nr:M48 family metallopeptidase [Burkholderiales bacterium]
MSNALTWTFLAALAAATATRLWLAQRQMRHVRAHRDAVPGTFAEAIPLGAHQKAADYTVAKARLGIVEVLVGAAVVLALTLGGVIDLLHLQWARLLEPGGLWHGVALIVSVVVLFALIDLPLSIYRTFVIEARYGFNRMTPSLFLVDLVKQAALAAALGIPLVLLVLWLMQKMGALWWLYVWFAWMAFNLLVLLLFPTFIAPLFNRFTKLEDPGLAGRIEALLRRCGFRASGLYVMDGSRRSSHGNAYFTGFGAAKRIVFFDTLLSRLAPTEVEAVLAHELGHYRLHHVWKRIALLFAASLGLLWVLGRLIEQPWFYAGLGVSHPSTAAALLLFMLAVPVFTFFLQPAASLYSRRHEFEADRYAAEHADSSELVSALVKLYTDNAATLTPDPVHSAFYDSHPPAAIRIARLRGAT